MTPRPVAQHERRPVLRALINSGIAPEALCIQALDRAQFIPFEHTFPPLFHGIRPCIAYFALRRRATGITLGTRIYVRENFFGRQGRLPLYFVTHEVAHVVQFMRDGTPTFLSRYLGEYALMRMRGVDDRSAYLAISYERQARRVESFLPPTDQVH